MIGSFVETNIQAQQLQLNVVRLNRDFIRDNSSVWVMKDGQLGIRDVNIVFRGCPTYAGIDSGLSDGDRVVTNVQFIHGHPPCPITVGR
ncbi:MAG: hypothetical protein U5J63_02985 [Fodinibius sp.]|nr:hypothetical protein [Fodinibius sp.]